MKPKAPMCSSNVNCIILLVLTYITNASVGQAGQANSVTLSPEIKTKEVQVNPGTTLKIEVANLTTSADLAFAIVEVHAYFVQVTISYNETLLPGFYTTGTNIGLVVFANDKSDSSAISASKFVFLTNDDPSHQVGHILLILQAYDSNAPIPGGCNMEESIQTAPFLPTQYTNTLLTVEFPLASWPLNVRPTSCDKTPQQYDIYQYYLPENDKSRRAVFDSILSMSGVNQAEANGRKIKFSGSPPSKIKLANYKGTGRIVVVIARALTSSASYVPTVSFGCNPYANNTEQSEETCEILESSWTKLLVASLFFVGLFHAALGHRFYKTHLFLHGFTAVSVVAYIAILAFANIEYSVVQLSTVLLGGLGGLLTVLIWCRFDVPLFAVFLGCLLSGFVFASSIAYTPLADFAIMKNDAEFWLAFSSLVLVMPILLVPFTHLASIICTALLGSFLSIIILDLLVGSNLKYIMFNVFHRATEDKFQAAIVDPTFQSADLILAVTWALLALTGVLFQRWREKDRPPFPNRPQWFTSRPSLNRIITIVPDASFDSPTEVTPLLYNSVTNSPK